MLQQMKKDASYNMIHASGYPPTILEASESDMWESDTYISDPDPTRIEHPYLLNII